MLWTFKQTWKKNELCLAISKYQLPIRSDQYLFSCWWLFFSLDIVCCCYCDCFYCFFSFSGYLQILSERDRLLLLTILQFYFLLCRNAAGTFVFFLFIRLLILRRRHSFFFSDNSISHLTNALTLANNGIEKKNTLFLSFAHVNEARFFLLHVNFFLLFGFNCSNFAFFAHCTPLTFNVNSIEIQHG